VTIPDLLGATASTGPSARALPGWMQARKLGQIHARPACRSSRGEYPQRINSRCATSGGMLARMACRKAGRNQIPASRRFPIQHFARNENTPGACAQPPSSHASNFTPPAVEIASSSGRNPACFTGNAFSSFASSTASPGKGRAILCSKRNLGPHPAWRFWPNSSQGSSCLVALASFSPASRGFDRAAVQHQKRCPRAAARTV